MINRLVINQITRNLDSNKAIIILGARQTGKTTLLNQVFKDYNNVLWLNTDEQDTLTMFEDINSTRLKAIIGDNKYVVIDEAQRIKNVGLKFKLITDQIKNTQLIATGSSSFELANKINEPLTGRKFEYKLFPLSYTEIVKHQGILEENRMLHHRLIYGYYPEVVTNVGKEKETLRQLSDSYLYKDILMHENIKKPEKLIKLMQSLAFQVGSEVSYNALGKTIGLDNETVEKYISLLEQTYIIFKLGAFSRNLRKELKRGRKIYFYDNGIRNAIINNFTDISLRNDSGILWENFVISERIKHLHYNDIWSNIYFWRTQDQQEIDLIEERDGILYAFEIKWNKNAKARLSKTFSKAYPDHIFEVITPENLEQFLNPE